MEKKKEIIDIVNQLIKRSEGKLVSARILLESDRIDDAISRAYYAAFLSVRALLYLLGVSARTHSGVLTIFGLRVIKEGLLPPKIGKYLNELFEARETSDYAVMFYYTKEDGKKYIQKAEEIINAVKNLLKDKFKLKFET
ncbi:MAG: HEPN domain-containing protein [Candidatus Odinarchaeota archaeon]|nr:HEPN domain-containing protein [Candidatus Odinarchaeota archaeon]